MSDRFVFHASKESVEAEFEVQTKRADYFEPNYNVTPGDILPVVYQEEGRRALSGFRWGMIPKTAGDEREGLENTDIDMEQLKSDESLRAIFDYKRCLVPASGFYKWKTSKKKSTPFYIRLLSKDLIAFAGIYSVWKASSGREVYSFALVNTESNTLVQPVSETMPVIMRPANYKQWLSEDNLNSDELNQLTKPYLLTEMAVNRVSEDVNDPSNNNEELIQPIPK